MRELIHRGLRLEYEVIGEGVPLVFLHGMGGSVNQIYSTYEPHPGVKLITMNQQGHGNSDAAWDSFDFYHLGDDAAALLDELQIDSAYFAGISMGAAVSLNVALRYPKRVKKLLLIRNAWTDKPMSEKVCRAYYDMGMALKKKSIEAFYETEGWEIVREPSAYTRNAFTCTFSDESCLKNWQKYLILPKKTPAESPEEFQKLTMPVTILANRNDLCHPFSYGEYMHKNIPNSIFMEIPDKDTDGAMHKQMINQAISNMLKE